MSERREDLGGTVLRLGPPPWEEAARKMQAPLVYDLLTPLFPVGGH